MSPEKRVTTTKALEQKKRHCQNSQFELQSNIIPEDLLVPDRPAQPRHQPQVAVKRVLVVAEQTGEIDPT